MIKKSQLLLITIFFFISDYNTCIEKQKELHDACSSENYKKVKKLLKAKVSVNTYESDGLFQGNTPLQIACEKGNTKIVRLLLKHHANANKTSKGLFKTGTPLHIACENSHIEIIKLLLSYNACMNIQSSNGWIPLHVASKKNDPKCAQLLLEYNAQINTLADDGWTPLHVASFYNCPETVQLLLKYGARIDIQNNSHWTPLHCASALGYIPIVTSLVCESFASSCYLSNKIMDQNNNNSLEVQLLQKLCLITLAHNLNNYTDESIENQIMPWFVLIEDDSIYQNIVKYMDFNSQQKLLSYWNEKKEMSNIVLLFNAHCQCHLDSMQYIINIKDDMQKSALDIANGYSIKYNNQTSKKHQDISKLLIHILETKGFNQLDANFQDSIKKNYAQRLNIDLQSFQN